ADEGFLDQADVGVVEDPQTLPAIRLDDEDGVVHNRSPWFLLLTTAGPSWFGHPASMDVNLSPGVVSRRCLQTPVHCRRGWFHAPFVPPEPGHAKAPRAGLRARI